MGFGDGGEPQKETKIVDIYDGKLLTVWEDEDTVFLAFPVVCVYIPKEDFSQLLDELKEVARVYWKQKGEKW